MKLGQTSAVTFLANVGTAVVGFLATIYFTRNVPSELLGSYFLIVAVLIWLTVVVGHTVKQAVSKRLSESGDGAYVGAGLAVQGAGFLAITAVLLAVRGSVNDYLGVDAALADGVVAIDGTLALVGLLAVAFAFSFVRGVLEGQHDVHVSALLKPVDRVVRSTVQVGAVALGFGLLGLLVGYWVAAAVSAVAGTYFVAVSADRPTREHVRSLFEFARYSWLGMIGARAFASMDTVVLGLFVANNLIAYYEIAWNLASLLAVFGVAISRTLFPELSKLGAEGENDRVRSLVNDGLAFTGIFVLPGLVGSYVVGERVLAIYEEEYTRAATVLVVLVLARAIHIYGTQFTNALNAMDRPDLAFRINGVFVLANVAGNLVLVYYYGWIGAAVATAGSAVATLLLGYRTLDRLVGIEIPYAEIGRQAAAALLMGVVVAALSPRLPGTIPWTGVVVGTGAAVYFALLTAVSGRFRRTVARNLPV